MGAKYYGGRSSGSSSSRQTITGSSSIDAPAGTLSARSAETGQQYSTVSERKQTEVFRAGEVKSGVTRSQITAERQRQEAIRQFGSQQQQTQPSGVKQFGGKIQSVADYNKAQQVKKILVPSTKSVYDYTMPIKESPIKSYGGEIKEVELTPQQKAYKETQERLKEKYKGYKPSKAETVYQQIVEKGKKRVQEEAYATLGLTLGGYQPKENTEYESIAVGNFLAKSGSAGVKVVQKAPSMFQRVVGKVSPRTGQYLKSAGEYFEKRPILQTGKQVGTIFLETEAIGRGTVKATEKLYGKETVAFTREAQELSAYTGDVFQRDKQGVPIGYKPSEELRSKGFIKNFPQEVLTIIPDVYSSSKQEFKKNVADVARMRGVPESEIQGVVDKAVKARYTLAGGEALVLGNVERFTEKIGGMGIRSVFKEAGKVGQVFTRKELTPAIAKKTVFTFVKGGAVEGAFSELGQSRVRGREITPFNIALGVGTGAVVAPVFGVPTASFAPTSPTISKLVGGVGTIIDVPFETVGDVAHELSQRTVRRLTGQPIRRAGVQRLVGKADKYVLTEISESLPSGATRIRVPSLSNIFGFTSQTQQRSQVTPFGVKTPKVPSRSLFNIFGFTPKTPVPVSLDTPKVPTTTKIDIPSLVPTETPTTTPTTTETGIPSVSFNIPVVTPVYPFRGALPVPPPFETDNGRGVMSRQRKVFVNELAESQKLFMQQLGFNVNTLFKKRRKK